MSKVESKRITLKNVRLSFPSLWKRAVFDGNEGKYEATLLLDKESQADQIEMIRAEIKRMVDGSGVKVAHDKFCLKDGDHVEYDGYAGCMSVKAAANKRPTVIDRDKTPLMEEDGKPYAGCYVNAVIDIWIQNNGYGKRANANLYGIQFVKDGEAFGSGPVDVSDDFDDLDDL
jgi:hypothetical protein